MLLKTKGKFFLGFVDSTGVVCYHSDMGNNNMKKAAKVLDLYYPLIAIVTITVFRGSSALINLLF